MAARPQDDTVTLTVKALSGAVREVRVRVSDTVWQLKQAIDQAFGLGGGGFRAIFNNRLLEIVTRRLSDYGIQTIPGQEIRIVLDLSARPKIINISEFEHLLLEGFPEEDVIRIRNEINGEYARQVSEIIAEIFTPENKAAYQATIQGTQEEKNEAWTIYSGGLRYEREQPIRTALRERADQQLEDAYVNARRGARGGKKTRRHHKKQRTTRRR